ncbi:MAG: class I SAM-dependent methyltransferase [Candidatus Taylorbacteria bacterium]|nr:class I SAM-dependent methyltransferase [Candidatus Taylorbacteria bacterium]
MAPSNRSKEILLSLGLVREDTIVPFFPRVRDSEEVSALRDTQSGIIFLNRTDHITLSHYEDITGGSYWGSATRDEALKKYGADDERRFKQFTSEISGKDLVDIGCGTGGLLDLFKPVAKSVAGVEPQAYVRGELTRLGYPMYRLPSDMPAKSFDIATLFHTLEHVAEPLEMLQEVRKVLRPGGVVIIEVPHARDVLFKLDAFKKFSLWSEHLILHTKESLRTFLEKTGFVDIEIVGFQRYSLANHIGWLVDGTPGGQERLAQFSDSSMGKAYVDFLTAQDKTDTLLVTARV